jgi:hypothetical protein
VKRAPIQYTLYTRTQVTRPKRATSATMAPSDASNIAGSPRAKPSSITSFRPCPMASTIAAETAIATSVKTMRAR